MTTRVTFHVGTSLHFFDLLTSREVDPKSTGRPEGTRPHESFSLVSAYWSVSKPRGDSPMGKGILYLGGSATQNLHCFSVGGWHA
jgi:hypothetical protein